MKVISWLVFSNSNLIELVCMNARIRVTILSSLVVLGLIFLGAFPNYFNPLKDVKLDSSEFKEFIVQAEAGSKPACNNVAGVYHLHKKYTEAINYWECGKDNTQLYKSPALRHLAGYYFHGLGIEKDQAQGAMYLILSDSRYWPRDAEKSNMLWRRHNGYRDIHDVPNIDKSFEQGALLAKQYIYDHKIANPRLTETKIDLILSENLERLHKAKGIIFFRRTIFLLFLFVLSYGLVESFKNRSAKKD